LDLAVHLHQLVHHLVVDGAVHQQTGARGTDLTGVDVDGEEGTTDGIVELGILEDNVRGLAAELQGQRVEVLGGGTHDLLAGGHGPGEGDAPDVRVRHQCGTGILTQTGDHVEHTGGKTRLNRDAGEFNGGDGEIGR